MRHLKGPWGLIFLLLFFVGCQQPGGPGSKPQGQSAARAGGSPDDPTPLVITLSEGEKSRAAVDAKPKAVGVPLSNDRIAELLKMFPEPLEVEKDKPAFLKRPSSQPAPTAAIPKELPFPAPTEGPDAPKTEVKDFEVLSVAPEGEIERAPRLSISFSTPMIAVSAPSSDEAGDPLGITISPRPEGKWRWLGTQTLIFEPKGAEFPRATEYKVTIPAGIADIQGSKLAKQVTQSFALPRPKVQSVSQDLTPQGLQPTFFIEFEQPVKADSVSKLTKLEANGKDLALEVLSASKAEKGRPGITNQFSDHLDGRVYYFKPREKLKPGTSYQIQVGKGLASTEGPLTMAYDWSHSFSTYQPLTLASRYPQNGEETSPFDQFYINFNNALDPEKFSEDMVTVTPPIENLKVMLSSSSLYIHGIKNGKSEYKVTVSKKLTDTFGQKLGEPLTLTFKTGRAPKALSHGFDMFTVLDPSAKASLPIYSTNVDELTLRVYKVTPDEWTKYLKFRYDYDSAYTPEDKRKFTPPGQKIEEKSLSLKGEPDRLISTQIELQSYLDNGEGNLIIWATDPTEDKENYRSREFFTWVQGTKLGIDLELGPEKAVVMVSNLTNGKAVAGAKVQMGETGSQTDEQGLASFGLNYKQANICRVETEESTAFLPHSTSAYGYRNGWQKQSLSDEARWFLFDDRGLYKPGETAYVKGYVRKWTRGPQGQLAESGSIGEKIGWTLNDSRGNKISEGNTELNGFGGIEIELKFPTETNLGNHQLTLTGSGVPYGYHSLNVQEFRRPEFEVKTSVTSDGPHMLLGDATVEATAAYYAGGGLAGSKVDWSVTSSPSSYTPPKRGKYTFGKWSPWWDMGPWWDSDDGGGSNYLSFQGRADGEGSHQLKLKFEKMYPPKPTSVSVTASVADVNRQQMSGSTTLLVHPSERYVGLKTDKSFVEEDSGFEMQSIVTDIDGKMLVGIPMTVELFRIDYDYDNNGRYRQIEKLVQSESLISSEVATDIKLNPKEGGTYKVRASVTDESNRLNQTEYTLWKAGGILPSKDKVELENLTLVPDRKEYKPGDVARILVMAPFSDGEVLVVWSRDGVESEERLQLKNGSVTVKRELTDVMIPNLHLSITAVGKAKYGKGHRPAVAAAGLNLSISKESRKLSIELLPSKDKLEPGAEVDVDVVVKDHQGEPVKNSEVTLWIVDEAVLGLVGYQTPNPLSHFYTQRSSGLSAYHSRVFIALGNPEFQSEVEEQKKRETGNIRRRGDASGLVAPAPMAKSAPGKSSKDKSFKKGNKNEVMAEMVSEEEYDLDDGLSASVSGETQEAKKFSVRKNFDALATFKGKLATDATGKTSVKVKLPDNLTRYRIMSVAVKDSDKYGQGDHLLTARLPIMVRPSLPRFLNFGDKAKLPVVIQNQTDAELSVDLVGEASGVVWIGAAGQTVKVPANDRVEVQFEAEAHAVGRAHFRFGAVSGKFSDAATLSLPVYTPASGEAFATYGSVDKDGAIKQLIRRPGDVWSQFGGLKISLSSTALSELTDAFLYLYEYPYECSEQKSSRILGVAAMREVLSAFNQALMPTDADIEAQMAKDLLHLTRLQNSDGGFEYWRRDEDSEPFVSVHVAHALARAKLEGYQVNDNTLSQALYYLSDIESKCAAKKYDTYTTRSLTAYALYVQNLSKAPDVSKAKSLFKVLVAEKQANLEAIGWLWPTLSQHAKDSKELKQLRTFIKNKATQTADKAQFSISYGEGDGQYLLLQSSRRTDAILLASMLGDEPKNQLNTKLVRGLLAHRTKGRWSNTQENIWVLLALQSYFRSYEKETPNFLAQVWLKSDYLGEEKFQGRSGKEAQLNIPMEQVPSENTDLIVGKRGAGRLYYRIGMKYAPKSLRLPAENRGFIVERSYKGLDKPEDVVQSENGDWTIKAGAKVEVTLTMVVPERRYHVALVDQLPAGLEPLNPSLQGTPPVSTGGSVKQSRGYGWWWRWYNHENLRDERVEAFASLVYPGVYTYSYTALATTPGEYVLPPLKAEEMYSPEVFGRTATGRLTVE